MARWHARANPRAGAKIHRSGRPHRRRAQAPGRTLRRHEAARRHRARALDRAEDHADGRAVLGARCAHARNAARRSAAHLPDHRADRVHDHARRGRGDLSRRPHRADDQRARREARRDRRQPAAEGSRARRHPPPPALLRGAQPHHRFPRHALEELRRRDGRPRARPAQRAGGAAGRDRENPSKAPDASARVCPEPTGEHQA